VFSLSNCDSLEESLSVSTPSTGSSRPVRHSKIIRDLAREPPTGRFLVTRAKQNYWVDAGIGIDGLLSATSGLVFLIPGEPTTGILGVSYQVWRNLHTWSSLGAIVGVGAHMALHWKWMVAMTRQMFSPKVHPTAMESVPERAHGEATSTGLSRRSFLVVGGAATLVAGAALAGYKAVFDPGTAQASPMGNQRAAPGQEGGVACPFGLVNDPYPGRCRFYIDSDGDGICDYSVQGSGSDLTTDGEGRFGGGFPGRRPRWRQP